jgi:hypothetical protein
MVETPAYLGLTLRQLPRLAVAVVAAGMVHLPQTAAVAAPVVVAVLAAVSEQEPAALELPAKDLLAATRVLSKSAHITQAAVVAQALLALLQMPQMLAALALPQRLLEHLFSTAAVVAARAGRLAAAALALAERVAAVTALIIPRAVQARPIQAVVAVALAIPAHL